MSQPLQRRTPSRRDRSLDLSVPHTGTPARSYPRRRSSPRLAEFDYCGGRRYHVVFLTKDRAPHLAAHRWAGLAVQQLHTSARLIAFAIDAYCVMPNHIHALVAGGAERVSSLFRYTHHFKQALGYVYKQTTKQQLWHRSYYDHVLRPEEPADAHARHILNNPVRAELVMVAADWASSGPAELLKACGEPDASEDLSPRAGRFRRELFVGIGNTFER